VCSSDLAGFFIGSIAIRFPGRACYPLSMDQAKSISPPEFDEASMVAKLQQGDPQAYEQVIRAYGGRLLAVARRLLRNDEDAADALQDAFLSAFKSIKRFEGGSKLSTWLHRIVVNASLMKLRSHKRHPTVQIDHLLPQFHADGHRVQPSNDWQLTGVAALERQENREMVRRSIDELPDTYRTVLSLRDIEEMDTATTARMLGINEGAVKTRLHRARLALREQLAPHFSPRTSDTSDARDSGKPEGGAA